MDTIVYVMWASFLLGLGAGAWRLGAIVRDVLREPLPAHVSGAGTSRVKSQTAGGTRRASHPARRISEPDPAWLQIPSMSERARAARPEPRTQPGPTPGSEPRHTSVSRPTSSPRWSEMLAETLREADAVMGR